MSDASETSPVDPAPETVDDHPGVTEILDLELMQNSDVVAALDQWRQGDLVSGVRLFWANPSGFDPLSQRSIDPPYDGGWDVQRLSIDADDVAPSDGDEIIRDWGVITSQTCDVVGTGPGARHPTVQVAPLLRLDIRYPGKVDSVRRGQSGDLIHVPNTPGEGFWAADLRISLPVSKSILLDLEPVHGFLGEETALAFGESVAAKIRRPALHNALSDYLVPKLTEFVDREVKKRSPWPARIEQFRLFIVEGTALAPTSVRLYAILLDTDLLPEERAVVVKWSEEVRSHLRREHNIVFEPVSFVAVDSMRVRDYRAASPLRVPRLGRRSFW